MEEGAAMRISCSSDSRAREVHHDFTRIFGFMLIFSITAPDASFYGRQRYLGTLKTSMGTTNEMLFEMLSWAIIVCA